MNALPRSFDRSQPSYSTAFQQALSTDVLREKVPAVFAPAAHERLSASYTFVPTAQVLDALRQAGFLPVEARQAKTRSVSPLHARHLIRLRRRLETVALREAVPELWVLNSHDGTSAYLIRAALYRAICTNGLVVSVGVLPAVRVLHRGDILDDIVRGALEMSERFGVLATVVERMERTLLTESERLEFAGQALALRYPNDPPGTMTPSDLLTPRRPEDVGSDLWCTTNVLQEALLQGGIVRRAPGKRLTRTRRITAFREELRLNSALWDLAMARAS
jgi:hypothetical protein